MIELFTISFTRLCELLSPIQCWIYCLHIKSEVNPTLYGGGGGGTMVNSRQEFILK